MKSLADSQDVELLRQSLASIPEPVARPVLVIVSGLPGTGKSYISRCLAERAPLVILETDALRKALCPSPTYSPAESSRLFQACHLLIEELLQKGTSLIFDATNLMERHRERLYNIADRLKAKLVIVRVEAPLAEVQQRLQNRSDDLSTDDTSTASWGVYQRMKPGVERIRRNHFVVDTSKEITPVIDKVVKEINRWARG